MKIFKRNIALFILSVSVITFNGAGFFHHHHSIIDDENHCQACHFSNILSSADLNTEPCLLNLTSFQPNYIKIYSIPDSEPSVSSTGRSPPQVSHI